MASNYSEGGRRLGSLGRRAIFGAPPSRQEQIAAILSQVEGKSPREVGGIFIGSGVEELQQPGQELLTQSYQRKDATPLSVEGKRAADVRGGFIPNTPAPFSAEGRRARDVTSGLISGAPKPESAKSDVGQLTQDFLNQKISAATFEARMASLTAIRGAPPPGPLRRAERAKAGVKRFSEFLVGTSTKAEAAEELLSALRIQQVIPNIETGGLQPQKTFVVSMAEAIKVKISKRRLDSLVGTQNFLAIQELMVNASLRRNKGIQTEGDATRTRTTFANIKNLEEANAFIQNMLISFAERDIMRDQFFQDWSDQDKGPFSEAKRSWTKFIRETPLMGFNPIDGNPVFIEEFIALKPKIRRSEAIAIWRKEHGRRQKR